MKRLRYIALALGAAALVGLSIFGVLALRAIDVEHVPLSQALSRFEEIRKRFRDQTPLIEIDEAGRVARRSTEGSAKAAGAAIALKRLEVVAYYAADERLVTAHVPFWFLTTKGPAAEFALRDTGFDLEQLHLTPADLSRRGPGLVLDQTRATGDRLIVWTE